MKVTCDATALSTALAALAPLVSGPGQRSRASHGLILLEATEGGRLSCRAETPEQDLSYQLAAEAHDPGTAVVPGVPLTRFVRAAPEGPAELTLDEPTLGVRCGQARLTLKTAPATVFQPSPVTPPPDLTLQAGILARLFTQTCFAAGADSDRPVLCGVLVTVTGATIQLTATDGRRVAQAWRRDHTPPSNGEHVLPMDLLVPRRSALTLQGLLRDSPADAPATLALAKNRLLVAAADWFWHAQLLGGTYPDVTRAIPTTESERCEVAREALLAALSQAAILARGSDGVELRLAAQSLAVSGTADGEVGRVEIPARWAGIPRTVALNPRLLTQALEAIDGASVQLTLHGDFEPLVVTAEASPQWRYLLMPIARPGTGTLPPHVSKTGQET
jgi:DNA polymerase-3 subunit beta